MSAGVSVRVEEATIPTTAGPVHSPYSRFGWSGWRGTYPYSTQTDLTSEMSDRTHRIVTSIVAHMALNTTSLIWAWYILAG